VASVFVDHNLSPSFARLLRQAGHAVTTAAEMQLDRASDVEILHIAGLTGLVVVTADEDFADLHRSSGLGHAGILILPQVHPQGVRGLADVVLWLLFSERPLRNELYAWSEASGWVREP
jgi:predicted nuclease of predicted toxin-antitoxin system